MARSVERMRQGKIRVVAALVATWPSSETGRVHARLLRYTGADAVLPARRAVRRAARLAGRGGPIDIARHKSKLLNISLISV